MSAFGANIRSEVSRSLLTTIERNQSRRGIERYGDFTWSCLSPRRGRAPVPPREAIPSAASRRAVPSKGYDFALVSDHGFERVDRIANLKAIASTAGISGDRRAMGGLAVTSDPKVADWLRAQTGRGDVGRENPREELLKYAPGLADAVAAFEPPEHVMFGRSDRDAPHSPPPEKGNHGFWPLRANYRSVFLLSRPGIKPQQLGPVDMLSLEGRLAAL